MEEKGKKRNRKKGWIILVVFLLFIVGLIVDRINLNRNPSLSKNEWLEMLEKSFGQVDVAMDCGEEPVTGEYVALTTMRALGDERLFELTGEVSFDDKRYIEIATEFGVIPRSHLLTQMSKKAASNVIVKALDLYFDLDNYPEYFEIMYQENVIVTEHWKINSYKSEENILSATIEGELPEEGKIIVFTDEYGITKAKAVESYAEGEGNEYIFNLGEVENLADITETISFSGKADFGYLAHMSENTENGGIISSTVVTAPALLLSAEPIIQENIALGIGEWVEENTTFSGSGAEKANVEIAFVVEDSVSSDSDEVSIEATASIKVQAPDGVTTTYAYEVDADGKDKLTVESEIGGGKIESKFEEKSDEKDSDKNSKIDASAGNSVSGTIKFNNLIVAASGYVVATDWDDEKNYVEVLVNSDVEFESKVTGEFNLKGKLGKGEGTVNGIKVGSFPIPIAATGGTVCVYMNVYLLATLSGELVMIYTIDDVYAGTVISAKTGFDYRHGHGAESLDVTAKVELEAGLMGESKVLVFDTWNVADPGIEIKAKASAETLACNEGFEAYEQCVQLGVQAPLVTLEASTSDDSMLSNILSKFNSNISYELISEDSQLCKRVDYHIETELDGAVNYLKGKEEDVCTHKLVAVDDMLEDTKSDLEESINEEIDKRKNELQAEIEQAVIDIMEDILIKSCAACY